MATDRISHSGFAKAWEPARTDRARLSCATIRPFLSARSLDRLSPIRLPCPFGHTSLELPDENWSPTDGAFRICVQNRDDLLWAHSDTVVLVNATSYLQVLAPEVERTCATMIRVCDTKNGHHFPIRARPAPRLHPSLARKRKRAVVP